jgi:hypothetical protein
VNDSDELQSRKRQLTSSNDNTITDGRSTTNTSNQQPKHNTPDNPQRQQKTVKKQPLTNNNQIFQILNKR